MGNKVRQKRILIVDDDADHVETLALLLSTSGHRVARATNPLYAMTLATEFNPELVLLDLRMPQMDGYEVARRMKRHFQSARFYAVTGLADDATRRRAEEAGFDGLFMKPLDPAVLDKLLDE